MTPLRSLQAGPARLGKALAASLLTAGCAAALMAPHAAHAVDYTLSGFGTVGYAVSDQTYTYQRFIDSHGSFKRDTVLGAQLDARLSTEWSATVQATLAPSLRSDESWALTPSWAFVSWRPGNDWLVRLGKQRVPLYLNSENKDVGQTYDFMRLPAEVYAMAPTNDCNGLYVSHNWLPDLGEVTLDVFMGRGQMDVRTYSRDLGPNFLRANTNVAGAALTLRTDSATWRVGLDHAITRLRNGQDMTSAFPYQDLGFGMGYYAVDPRLGPAGRTASILNDVIMVGADVEVAPGWRVVSELARNIQRRTDVGFNSAGGYVAVLHKMDRFTPYVSLARLRSMGASLRVVQQLDAAMVLPSPSFDQINAAQRIAADNVPVYDQTSVAIGTSYALTPQSKIKAEWLHTHIGKRSAMVDSDQGSGVISRQGINVLSVNYNFAF
jgi:opacity protein-like surface antigen